MTRRYRIEADEALEIIDPRLRSILGTTGLRDVVDRRQIPGDRSDLVMELLVHHRVAAWLDSETTTSMRGRGAWLMLLEHTLEQVSEAFDESGIDFRVLKGMATAKLDYPSALMREMVDVDLLVLPAQHAQAVGVLAALGFEPISVDRIDPLLVKGQTMRSPAGVEVDLHTRLNKFSKSRTASLFQRSRSQCNPVRALTPEDRLFHAATHLILTPPGHRKLSGLLDVVVISDRHHIDDGALRRVAFEHGQTAILGAALEIVSRSTLRDLPLPDLRPMPTRLEQIAHLRPSRTLPAEHLRALSAHESVRERLNYATAYLVPSRDALRTRGGLARYVRRALGQS